MSLLRPTRYPKVFRLRAGAALDSDGDPVQSWAAPERLRLKRATVQQSSSQDEDGAVRRTPLSETVWRLFVPGAVDLVHDDRIEVDGELYRVDGKPAVRDGLSQSVYTRALLVQRSD